MNVDRYLHRIRYKGSLRPVLSTLTALQEHHAYAVPFENIDIQTGTDIRLDPERFYQKVVEQKRGGYCYELNGLFYELLLHAGFDARLISGRVVKGKRCGPEFDHLAIMVKLEGRDWLVDVGFGDFSLAPLAVTSEDPQSDGRHSFLIKDAEIDGVPYGSVCRWRNAKNLYTTEYFFTGTARSLTDFEGMNQHHQYGQGSFFVQNFLCSKPLPNGRTSIINNRLLISCNGQRLDQRIEPEKLSALLLEHFGLELQGKEQLVKACVRSDR